MEELFLELERLKSQYSQTVVAVAYGMKRVSGTFTGEKGIIFYVYEKLPLARIAPSDILPSIVKVNDEYYITDVVETSKNLVSMNNCNIDTLNNCFPYDTIFTANGITYGTEGSYPINATQTWLPMRSGMWINSTIGGSASHGFLAIDKNTDALVGVSNQHVVAANEMIKYNCVGFGQLSHITRNKRVNWHDNTNNEIYHRPKTGGTKTPIGRVIKYPHYSTAGRFKDYALYAIYTGFTDNESWKPIGLDINYSPEFLTVEEIADAVGSPAFHTGGRTGAKGNGGSCDIILAAVGPTCFTISYLDQDCSEFITDVGDSGSPAYVNVNGVWKIAGIVEFGNGLGPSIFTIVKDLNIKAWDGSTPKFINPSTIKIKTVNNLLATNDILIDGQYYNALGVTLSARTNQNDIPYAKIKLNEFTITGTSNFNTEINYTTETIMGSTDNTDNCNNIKIDKILLSGFSSYTISVANNISDYVWLNTNVYSAVTYIKNRNIYGVKSDISFDSFNKFNKLNTIDLSFSNLTGFTFNGYVPSGLTNLYLNNNNLSLNAVTNILTELNSVPVYASPGKIRLDNQFPSVTLTQDMPAYQAFQSLTGKGFTVDVSNRGVKTYYMSSQGSDSHDGLLDTRPWKSLEKLATEFRNQTIIEGDTVLFKRGEIFSATSTNEYVIDLDGNVNAKTGTADLPIKIGAYGSSSQKPILMTNKNNILFRLANMNYYIFENLNFTDLSFNINDKTNKATFRRAIVLGGWITTPSNPTQLFSGASSNCTISNCDFSNMGNAVTIVGNYNLMSGCTISNLKAGADLPSNPSDIGGTGVFITGSYNQIFRGDISGCWYANAASGFTGGAIKVLNQSSSFNTLNYSTVSDCAGVLEIGTTTTGRTGNFNIVYNKLINNGKVIVCNNYLSNYVFVSLYNNVIVENSNSRFSGPNYGTGIKTIPSVWQVWSGRTYAPYWLAYSPNYVDGRLINSVNNIMFLYNGQTISQTSYLSSLRKNNIYNLSFEGALYGALGFNQNSTETLIFSSSIPLITNESNVNPLLWDYHLATGSIAKDAGVATYATAYPLDFDLNGVVAPPSIGIYD